MGGTAFQAEGKASVRPQGGDELDVFQVTVPAVASWGGSERKECPW